MIVEAGKFLIAVDVTDKNTSEPAAVKSEADAPPFLRLKNSNINSYTFYWCELKFLPINPSKSTTLLESKTPVILLADLAFAYKLLNDAHEPWLLIDLKLAIFDLQSRFHSKNNLIKVILL